MTKVTTLRVLVLDDEPGIAEEVADYLQAAGLPCDISSDTATAQAMLATAPEIAVLIADIRMPGGDGLALACQARAGRGEEAALEIMMLTGHGSLEEVVAPIAVPVFDFLRKPVRLAVLEQSVRRAMAAAAHRRAAACRPARATRMQATCNALGLLCQVAEAERSAANRAGHDLLVQQAVTEPLATDAELLRGLLTVLLTHAIRHAAPAASLTLSACSPPREVAFVIAASDPRLNHDRCRRLLHASWFSGPLARSGAGSGDSASFDGAGPAGPWRPGAGEMPPTPDLGQARRMAERLGGCLMVDQEMGGFIRASLRLPR
jgi:DNA-binding response OmpR family regulator